jgi:hypothetical protein
MSHSNTVYCFSHYLQRGGITPPEFLRQHPLQRQRLFREEKGQPGAVVMVNGTPASDNWSFSKSKRLEARLELFSGEIDKRDSGSFSPRWASSRIFQND